MKKRLPPLLRAIEHVVDHVIPYILFFLTILIILEFTEFGKRYHDAIVTIDYVIIAFFVIDLIFKGYHAKTAKSFIKLYWIDILAVFPFYLFFRFYFAAREIILVGEQAQQFLHEAVLIREARLLRQAELTAKLSKQGRFIRFFARIFRLLRARWYVAHWQLHKHSKAFEKAH